MQLWAFISLFVLMVALASLPGSSTALVIARTISKNLANGIAVALGIVLGDLFFIVIAIFGLSVIAESMATVFLVIKYLGGLYLLWFGFYLITSGNKISRSGLLRKSLNNNVTQPAKRMNLLTSLSAGLFITLGDIKAIFFYVSLLPAYIDLASFDAVDVNIILAITIIAVGGVKIFFALSANQIISFARKFNIEQSVHKVMGSIMLGTGSFLIAKA